MILPILIFMVGMIPVLVLREPLEEQHTELLWPILRKVITKRQMTDLQEQNLRMEIIGLALVWIPRADLLLVSEPMSLV